MILALVFLSGVLLLLAVFTIRRQIASLKRLKCDAFIPSDERSYLRNQAFRRLATGMLIFILAGMLAGAYLSGLENRAEELGRPKPANEQGEKPAMNEEQKDFMRLYFTYWISVIILVFVVISLAIVDLWSTRRYAWQQLRRIQSENRAMLERDLAMYRQQKANDRMRGSR